MTLMTSGIAHSPLKRPPRNLDRLQIITFLGYLALALVVLGAKLMVIDTFGNPTPYWDQWESEGDRLYRPWLEGVFQWSTRFSPHNEHRILTERLLALGLLELNGRIWDTFLQMVVNALLHISALLVLLHFLIRDFAARQRMVLLVLSAVVLSIPFGWENTLWGAQSEIYTKRIWVFRFSLTDNSEVLCQQ